MWCDVFTGLLLLLVAGSLLWILKFMNHCVRFRDISGLVWAGIELQTTINILAKPSYFFPKLLSNLPYFLNRFWVQNIRNHLFLPYHSNFACLPVIFIKIYLRNYLHRCYLYWHKNWIMRVSKFCFIIKIKQLWCKQFYNWSKLEFCRKHCQNSSHVTLLKMIIIDQHHCCISIKQKVNISTQAISQEKRIMKNSCPNWKVRSTRRLPLLHRHVLVDMLQYIKSFSRWFVTSTKVC